MFRKQHQIPVLIITIVLILCSCTHSNDYTSTANNDTVHSVTDHTTQPTTQATTVIEDSLPAEPYADIDKIKEDLITLDGNCFYINGQNLSLDVESLEILRRKSDLEYDEIHIEATFANTYYKATANCILYYSYYDLGGWNLDNYEVSDYTITAVANPVTDSDMISFLQNHFTSITITDRIQTTDLTGTFADTINFTATLEYPYLSVNFNGWYIMEFYDDSWHDTYDFWINNYDWSALEDSFRYRNDSLGIGIGLYSADVHFSISNIEQIDDNSLAMTYSAYVYLFDRSGGYIEDDEEIPTKTTTLSINNKSITILGKEIKIPWEAGYIGLPWYGTFAVFLSRDNGVVATDDTKYGNIFAQFNKDVSIDDIQDALDKLNDMNS